MDGVDLLDFESWINSLFLQAVVKFKSKWLRLKNNLNPN